MYYRYYNREREREREARRHGGTQPGSQPFSHVSDPEEFAHKAAPTQWLVYSWVHSAKAGKPPPTPSSP